MRYAIIGCGRISPNHLAAAKANELELVAVSDLDKTAAQERLAAQGYDPAEIPFYLDFHDLLDEQKPEMVAICTDSGSHAEIGLACLESGAHVIIEKPIALSLEDADRLIDMAEAKGLKLGCCHQNRFNKSIQAIREAREKGRFGRMMYGTAHIRWNRNKNYYEQAPWRGTWAHDGGVLMNQCIHNIDLLRWMLGGEVKEVQAYTDRLTHDYIEAEDLGLAIVRMKNGSYGVIEGTSNVYPRNLEETLYLFGTEGTVQAGGMSANQIIHWNFADDLDDSEEVRAHFHENPPNVYGYGHTPLYADFIAAIREDRAPLVDGHEGRGALELVLGIYKAAADGQAVTFPLDDVATTDFTGRFPLDKE